MITYFLYIVMAMVTAWVFKIAAGIIFGIPTFIFSLLLGLQGIEIDEAFERHPRRFVLLGILNHSIIGAFYGFVIFLVTVNYLLYYGGNFWLYAITSVLWSLTIISGASAFYGTILAPCTLGLILAWLGFSFLGPIIIWVITILISIPYYMGRIDILKEQQRLWY